MPNNKEAQLKAGTFLMLARRYDDAKARAEGIAADRVKAERPAVEQATVEVPNPLIRARSAELMERMLHNLDLSYGLVFSQPAQLFALPAAGSRRPRSRF